MIIENVGHKVEIREMTPADAKLMAEQMRPIDKFEYMVQSGSDNIELAMEMVHDIATVSQCAYIDDELICCWGRFDRSIIMQECNPWMVATDKIEHKIAKRMFLKRSHETVRDLVGNFDRAWNQVYQGNKLTIRWLKWIGFEFSPDPEIISGHPFLRFEYGRAE